MTKKIFKAMAAIVLAALILEAALLTGVLYEYFSASQKSALREQARFIAGGIENNGISYLEGLDAGDCRITWVAPDGSVLYDSLADAALLENHADREEIQAAVKNGFGESVRDSATLTERTFYYAMRLNDGSVLRTACVRRTVFMMLLNLAQPMLLVLIISAALIFVMALSLSKGLVKPINSLNLEQPLENDSYEELSPLLSRIERQNRRIAEQMAELNRSRDEFNSVTESMSEGLVLLGRSGAILSMNPAAMRLFSADDSCIGRDMLTVDRSIAMQELIKKAQSGSRGEIMTELDGSEYQIDATPVISNGEVSGVCILSFDVTEKHRSEQMRREFSANVSHELKTPLQSIMGSAELIENGLVKPKDMPAFIGRIRTEAARLVTLIDDIIRLSQLDEGEKLPDEPVELLSLAKEAAAELSDAAAEKKVKINVLGVCAGVLGPRRLLHEIIFNLCDNAVKYNVENGRVDIDVSETEQGPLITVRDTGIGIPKEHQARVFERFYRVDKSHSRATGGTGLGLSIVKHAAQYMGAEIKLESEPGKGTTISVQLPRSAGL